MDEREVLRGRIRDLWNRTREGEYLNHTGGEIGIRPFLHVQRRI